ncbi:hypothetical protein ALC57_16295 [Trachymyrmex cornetzi]|uniref:Uncharacterized protein n=1 Tax=Trachymyrmex cornetzi TaxID=471704 RepID=A0A195DF94_9HYME|nr:hypothetical protein ALC57_16295 [Trachymyrmex cornetzi]
MLYDFQFTKYNGLFVPRFVKLNKTKLPHAGNTLSRCPMNSRNTRNEEQRRHANLESEEVRASRMIFRKAFIICGLRIELVMSADSAADISEGRLDEPKPTRYVPRRAAPPPNRNEDLFRILARHTRGSYKIYVSPTYFEFVFVATRGRRVMDG